MHYAFKTLLLHLCWTVVLPVTATARKGVGMIVPTTLQAQDQWETVVPTWHPKQTRQKVAVACLHRLVSIICPVADSWAMGDAPIRSVICSLASSTAYSNVCGTMGLRYNPIWEWQQWEKKEVVGSLSEILCWWTRKQHSVMEMWSSEQIKKLCILWLLHNTTFNNYCS